MLANLVSILWMAHGFSTVCGGSSGSTKVPPYHIQIENMTLGCNCGFQNYHGDWETLGDISNLPDHSGISKSVGGSIGNAIYMIGGIIGPKYEDRAFPPYVTTETRVFNTDKKSWHFAAELPRRLLHASSAIVEDTIYVVGGMINGTSGHFEAQDSLYAYDTKADNWDKRQSMKYKRGELMVCAMDGYIYAVGGIENDMKTESMPLGHFERYSIKEDEWETLEPLPGGRSSSAVACINGKVLVFSGWTNQNKNGPVRTGVAYDVKKKHWEKAPRMPLSTTSSSYASNGRDLIVFGGLSSSGRIRYEARRFKSDLNRWDRVKRMPAPNANALSAAVTAKEFYLLGGATCTHSGSFFSNQVYMLKISRADE
jgi:N-acetylneuraminic acid mutarotase